MKPFSGGSPMELNAAMRKTAVKTGITRYRPVYCAICACAALVNDAHDQEQHAVEIRG